MEGEKESKRDTEGKKNTERRKESLTKVFDV